MSGAHLPFPESAEDREAAIRLHSRTRVTVWPEADPFDRPEWHQRAACRGVGVDVFFSTRPQDVDKAKEYCARCPVRTECGLAARGEHDGVWAGVLHRDRYRTSRISDRPCAECGAVVEIARSGPLRRYCSMACSQRARRNAKREAS